MKVSHTSNTAIVEKFIGLHNSHYFRFVCSFYHKLHMIFLLIKVRVKQRKIKKMSSLLKESNTWISNYKNNCKNPTVIKI